MPFVKLEDILADIFTKGGMTKFLSDCVQVGHARYLYTNLREGVRI